MGMFPQALPASGSFLLSEHLQLNAICIVVLCLLDRLVVVPYVRGYFKRSKNQAGADSAAAKAKIAKENERDIAVTRWFFVHAIANGMTVVTCLRRSVLPLTIINAAHVYHMIGGFPLSAADYFHHLLFVPALGFPGQILHWGALANWQAFFISGLPGGIDYFVLGLVKINKFSKMGEKRLSANLNIWCRCPGILVTTILLYQSILYGKCEVHWLPVICQLLLPPYNALYYCKQSVANYAVHYMLTVLGRADEINTRVKTRLSVTLGGEVMEWKDALSKIIPKNELGEPQRGS